MAILSLRPINTCIPTQSVAEMVCLGLLAFEFWTFILDRYVYKPCKYSCMNKLTKDVLLELVLLNMNGI